MESAETESNSVMMAGMHNFHDKTKFQALFQELAEPLSFISDVSGLWFRWKNCSMVEMTFKSGFLNIHI